MLYENRTSRRMHSGLYTILDVLCTDCREVLGWYYEYAYEPSEREKEGKVVLEVAKMRRGDEREELRDNNTHFLLTSHGQLEVTGLSN